MKKYLPVLKNTKLFQGIREEEIEEMLGCLGARKREFMKGEWIYHVGDCITEVALVLEGAVHIKKEDYWGNLSILNVVEAGEVFGEAYAVYGSEPMVNDVVAACDTTVLFLDIGRVLASCPSTCHFHTLLIQNFFAVLAAKNRALAQKIGHMSQRTTREKLLSYLSEQRGRAKSPSFEIPFNRQQLADFLSVDRSAMSSELGKMRDEGIVEFNRNHFCLK
ncbi:Crp/Fnr family transcriptional regulator [Roseburia hominis]